VDRRLIYIQSSSTEHPRTCCGSASNMIVILPTGEVGIVQASSVISCTSSIVKSTMIVKLKFGVTVPGTHTVDRILMKVPSPNNVLVDHYLTLQRNSTPLPNDWTYGTLLVWLAWLSRVGE
jgi:hypothetical protein